jgi:hypothetical protein
MNPPSILGNQLLLGIKRTGLTRNISMPAGSVLNKSIPATVGFIGSGLDKTDIFQPIFFPYLTREVGLYDPPLTSGGNIHASRSR